MIDPTDDNGKLSELFAADGYLTLRHVLPPEKVGRWSTRYSTLMDTIFAKLFAHGHTQFPEHRQGDCYAMEKGIKNGFAEIVMRSPGRYEIAVHEEDKDDLLQVVQKALPFVPKLVQPDPDENFEPLTWNDVKIVNVSVVVSTPGASPQAWHADGGHMSLERHLPCHCLNIFIPLATVTLESGPTELRPGTHYHTRNSLAANMLIAKARRTLRPTVAPTLSLGDALIFDYRILHRGKANVSCQDRPVLVIAVAQPWFKDVLNFPRRSLTSTPGMAAAPAKSTSDLN